VLALTVIVADGADALLLLAVYHCFGGIVKTSASWFGRKGGRKREGKREDRR
jgi:hypothetical protein